MEEIERKVRAALSPVLLYRHDSNLLAVLLDDEALRKVSGLVKSQLPFSLPSWKVSTSVEDPTFLSGGRGWLFVHPILVQDVESSRRASLSDHQASPHAALTTFPDGEALSLKAYLEELENTQRDMATAASREAIRCFSFETLPSLNIFNEDSTESSDGQLLPLQKLHRAACKLGTVVRSTEDRGSQSNYSGSCHPNFVDPLCFTFFEEEGVIMTFYPHERFTLDSVFRFTKDFVSNDSTKQYVAEQLLRSLSYLHEAGVAHGNLAPSSITLSNLCWAKIIAPNTIMFEESPTSVPAVQLISWPNSHNWPQVLEEWVAGKISNFEYLMKLNELVGRRVGDPNFHPVLPWVIDFKSPTSWRDLAVSKFRQNKGDEQLDLTFAASSMGPAGGAQPPAEADWEKAGGHHVSDIMSELTFYNYFARRMPVWVLRRYVRTNYQPSEYPASLERLFSWSPDECIPEFYEEDQQISISTHADMPDLGLPEWSEGQWSRFVSAHRAALESPQVSEKLHHWIDLTFGFKLSGEAGRASKNVALMDRALPRTSGYVQLFSLPHPSRSSGSESLPESLLSKEHVARFLGHADRLECHYGPAIAPVNNADSNSLFWHRFKDMVAVGVILYQLSANQPLLHQKTWYLLAQRLDAQKEEMSASDDSDWQWWCENIATESSRIPSHRLSRIIFDLVFSNQLRVLQGQQPLSIADILQRSAVFERKGLSLVYGFAARFESLPTNVNRVKHALDHIAILTNHLPPWALHVLVPYMLPFFGDPSTQRIALELVEPLLIILGRHLASRLLLEHISTMYETRQGDSILYKDLVSFKFISMLSRQLGAPSILAKVIPYVINSLRMNDVNVCSTASSAVVELVGFLGPHVFVKHVLPVLVNQLTKPNGDADFVRETIIEVGGQLGDDYAAHHLFPLLLALLQRALFTKIPCSVEDIRISQCVLRIIGKVTELPALIASPIRVVKSLLVDHPLIIALLVYPHIYDKSLFPFVVDCVFSISRSVGTMWAVQHIRPHLLSVLSEPSSATAPGAPTLTTAAPLRSAPSPTGSLNAPASNSPSEVLHTSGWSVLGSPGAHYTPQMRIQLSSRFHDLLETKLDESITWTTIGGPQLTEFELVPQEKDVNDYGAPVMTSSVATQIIGDRSRKHECFAPAWLAAIPMGQPPPLLSAPLIIASSEPEKLPQVDADQPAPVTLQYSRSVIDQLNAWLNPKRSSVWGFSCSIAMSLKEHTSTVRQFAVHDTERFFLSASKDGTVKCWDLYGDGSSSRITYAGHKTSSIATAPSCVTFVDRGGLAASCDSSIHIWELERGTKVMQLDHPAASYLCMCPLQDGRVIAAATTQATVSLSDLRAPQSDPCEWLLPNNQSGLPRVVTSVSPDGYLLAVGQSSGYVTFIDTRSGLLLYSWHAHDGAVLDLKPWSDGRSSYLLSCSQDRSVALWSISSSPSYPASPSAVGTSPFGSTGGLGNPPALQSSFRGHRDPIICFDTFQDCLFSASGHKVSVSPILTPHAQVKLDRKRLLKPSLKPNYITCMSALSSTQLLLVGCEDGQIRVAY